MIQFKRSDDLSEFQVNQSRQNPMTQFKRSDAHSEFQVSQSSRQNSVIKSKHPGDSSVNQPSPILKKTDSQSDCQISPLSDQVKFPENQDSPVHSLQSNSPLNNFDLSQEDQTLTLKSLHELLSEERRSRVENEEKIRTLCATNEENIQKYLQQMASLRRDLEQTNLRFTAAGKQEHALEQYVENLSDQLARIASQQLVTPTVNDGLPGVSVSTSTIQPALPIPKSKTVEIGKRPNADKAISRAMVFIGNLKLSTLEVNKYLSWKPGVIQTLSVYSLDVLLTHAPEDIPLNSRFHDAYPGIHPMDIEFLSAGLAVALIKAYPKHFQFTELSLKQDPVFVWTTISSHCSRDTDVQRGNLRLQFESISLNKCGNNIRLFAARIHAIAEELDGLGHQITAEDKRWRLLHNLPAAYQTAKIILMRDKTLDFNACVSLLESFTTSVALTNTSVDSSALNATAFRGTCFKCGKMGHRAFECPLKTDSNYCSYCKSTAGHTIDQCPRVKKKNERTSGATNNVEAKHFAAPQGVDVNIITASVLTSKAVPASHINGEVSSASPGPRIARAFCMEDENSVSANIMTKHDDTWVVDSGCTDPMSGNRTLFSNLYHLEQPVMVQTATEAHSLARERGDVTIHCMVNDPTPLLRSFTIQNVLYVPGLRRNLLSVCSVLDAAGAGSAFVQCADGSTFLHDAMGHQLLHGKLKGKLYILDTVSASSSNLLRA